MYINKYAIKMSADIFIRDKVTRYEHFLNERLRTDLRAVLEHRDAVYSDMAEYLQLRNVLEKTQKLGLTQSGLKTIVDLGANFYAQARVMDPSRVFVAVGLGFFVEFTIDEALGFIDKKVALLTGKTNELTEQATQIRARIKLVLEGLEELQFKGEPPGPPRRDVW